MGLCVSSTASSPRFPSPVSLAFQTIAVLSFLCAFAGHGLALPVNDAYVRLVGSNYIVISSGARAGASMPRQRSTTAPPENSFITDAGELKRLTESYPVPFVPTYALLSRQAPEGRTRTQIVGVKGDEVWVCLLDGEVVNLRKLGHMVKTGHDGLRDFERSIVGAKVVLAYDDGKPGSGASDVVAILESEESAYAVRKLVDNSFAIDQIGVVRAH